MSTSSDGWVLVSALLDNSKLVNSSMKSHNSYQVSESPGYKKIWLKLKLIM